MLASLSVRCLGQAVEMLDWYALRRKIEVLHKILQSGCHAEDSQLRTAERVVNLIALCRMVSWRIFGMTILNRAAPEAEVGGPDT